MTRTKITCGAIRAVLMAVNNDFMLTHCLKLLFVGAICVAAVSLASSCRKSAQELAEQKAIERHEQDVQRRKELVKTIKKLDTDRISKSADFLGMLHESGRLPGTVKDADGELRLDKLPTVSPNGPYYWTLELHGITKEVPPRNLFYVLVQTYSNSDFQLQKAWRADDSGKVVEEYPIVAAPKMANGRRVFLGPANSGAESDFANWYNGVLGGGLVSIGTDDPATGLSYFKIGITNAAAYPVNHADLRSVMFPLGHAAKKHRPFTFSFSYRLPEAVKAGDNIGVNFRFFDETETNFLGQKIILVGSSTADSGMAEYKTMIVSNIVAPEGAAKADVWVAANIFDPWTSGVAQFDDFSVTSE
jgi:hypothetical protein